MQKTETQKLGALKFSISVFYCFIILSNFPCSFVLETIAPPPPPPPPTPGWAVNLFSILSGLDWYIDWYGNSPHLRGGIHSHGKDLGQDLVQTVSFNYNQLQINEI